MAHQQQKAGWTLRGWMSFTVADTQHLRLGGATPTVPTKALSGGKDETDPACFLLNGIPQNPAKTRFAIAGASPAELNGHEIKHAIIDIISSGATITPAARTMTDGSVPVSDHGQYVTTPDSLTIENGRQEIYNFDLINVSGGNIVVEVKVYS